MSIRDLASIADAIVWEALPDDVQKAVLRYIATELDLVAVIAAHHKVYSSAGENLHEQLEKLLTHSVN